MKPSILPEAIENIGTIYQAVGEIAELLRMGLWAEKQTYWKTEKSRYLKIDL